MFPTLKVLAVALEPEELSRIRQVLASGGVKADVVEAQASNLAGVVGEAGHLDVALLALAPETQRGLDVVREFRALVPEVPVVLLCGDVSPVDAVAAARTGVAECVAMQQVDNLAAVLLRVMEEAHAAGHVQGPPVGLLVDGAPDAILMVDHQRLIRVFNRAAQRMFQCSLSDAVGRPLEQFIPRMVLPCDPVPPTPAPPAEPLVGVRPGGTRFPLETSLATVLHQGHCWCTLTARDVTEQRRMEDQLAFAQKMEVFGQLAGGIAHDFNNILTVMMSLTDDMLAQLPGEHDLRWNAEELKEASSRAAALTRQLLVFSRRQAIHPTRVMINKVLDDNLKLLRRSVRESVQLEPTLDPAAGEVEVDVGQLEQVLLNLVLNASDAMPRGGHVKVTTQLVVLIQPLSDALGTIPPGRYVRLCVEDDGAGMPPHVLARVFEPFFTTRAVGRGSGLGLSVCLGIIKQAGGHIALTSVHQQGTRAVVHLPLARAAADQPSSTDASGHLRGHETVLVVEDEPVVRKLVQRSLGSLGYKVLAARDAAHALELLASDQEDVGVLLTDVVMPDMSGPALAQRARVINPCLPVLFMTGYLDDLSQGQMRDVVDSQVLVKPFSHPQLAARIRSLLDGG